MTTDNVQVAWQSDDGQSALYCGDGLEHIGQCAL